MMQAESENHDPRSRFHRACIHVGWAGLIVTGTVLVLMSKSEARPNWFNTVDAITSILSIVVGLGFCWILHSRPPGQKVDFLCGPARHPTKPF